MWCFSYSRASKFGLMKYKCNKAKGKQIFIAEDLENQSVPDPPPPLQIQFLKLYIYYKITKKKKYSSDPTGKLK